MMQIHTRSQERVRHRAIHHLMPATKTTGQYKESKVSAIEGGSGTKVPTLNASIQNLVQKNDAQFYDTL